MGAGPGRTDGLHHAGDSFLHRLPADVKIVATVLFVLAVVATPREAFWAFAVDALAVLVVAAAAGLPARLLRRRLHVEVPFLAFAVLLPIVGAAPHTEVLGISLSEPGLWAAWNIVAKATLGVLAATVLAATTPVTEILSGLDRLRVPRVLTAIAGFMVRYLDLVVGEADRMRIARLSRGHDARWLWQSRAIASSAGHLFVRSYERGERVHLAMASRGYTGTMPVVHEHRRPPHSWLVASALPAVAATAMLVARVVTG